MEVRRRGCASRRDAVSHITNLRITKKLIKVFKYGGIVISFQVTRDVAPSLGQPPCESEFKKSKERAGIPLQVENSIRDAKIRARVRGFPFLGNHRNFGVTSITVSFVIPIIPHARRPPSNFDSLNFEVRRVHIYIHARTHTSRRDSPILSARSLGERTEGEESSPGARG